MKKPLRIGLISEGEAELGNSVPFISDPMQGGSIIKRSTEGALHTLVRRELLSAGFDDCVFIHRHPTIKERHVKYRVGYSIIQPKYLAQVVIAWKPEEVDMIVVVVDEDDKATARRQQAEAARQRIADNHLDADGTSLVDRNAVGIAIKSFDTWLLADIDAVIVLLDIGDSDRKRLHKLPNDLETLPGDNSSPDHAKRILDSYIEASDFRPPDQRVQNLALEARWSLAFTADLDVIKQRCQSGYSPFIVSLVRAATNAASDKRVNSSC